MGTTQTTATSGDILQDLEAGEPSLSLNAARNEPLLQRDGKRRSLPAIYRLASLGVATPNGRVKLETANLCGITVTTRSSIIRLIRRASAAPVHNTSSPRPSERAKSIHHAEQQLAAAGI